MAMTTTDVRSDAERLARDLVERRLAACVQVLGPISSTYRWRGAIETADEWLCIIKTTAARFDALAAHNGTESRTRELLDRHGDEGELVGTFSTAEFVAALAPPRRILVMVKAGPAV